MRRKLLFVFCLFIFCAAQPDLFAQQLGPGIVWQKCLGGSGDDKANSIVRTVDGGFIIAGSSTSNNGDVSGHHGSSDSTDGWVVKISATGSVQWQLSPGGSGTDVFNSVIALADGNFLCMGTTTSNDGDVSGDHGRTDWWVVKISRYGAIIWSKCYGGSLNEVAGNVKENQDGSLYLIGSTASRDGDVIGHQPSGSIYDLDIWVVKLNNDGSINWGRCFGSTVGDGGYDINESDNGSFVIGMTSDGTDGDFGSLAGLSPRGAIIKIASDYSVLWKIFIPASKPIALMPTGNVYDVNTDVLGCIPNLNNFAATQYEFTDIPSSSAAPPLITNSNYTFCQGGGSDATFVKGYLTAGASGIARINAIDHVFAGSSDDTVTLTGFHGGFFDGFVSGYRTNTGITYQKLLGGTGDDEFTSVSSIDPYDYIVAGFTNSNDGDVSGNHGGYDVWVVKLGRVNTIKGTVYQDYNHNNVKDANEPFVNSIIIQSQKGMSKSASSTYDGYFENQTDTGTYNTTVLAGLPYYTAVPAVKSSSFTSYNNSDSFSFALQPVPGMRDYGINLWINSGADPGFPAGYRLLITNNGTDTLTNKQVSMIMDSRMQYISSAPAQASISGDTITWMINRLAPRDTTSIWANFQLSAPPELNYNDTLFLSAMIDSSGDVHSPDNSAVLYQRVLGSFDPNSKEEVHDGSIALQDVRDGKNLLYTIRFQNTGNDTAYTVVIRDTLESKLDAASLSMVAASHPYRLTIQDSCILTWTFQNIRLADSTHNEPASHGYVSYRIKPGNSLNTGDAIKNTSSAYFDFNLPVQTNTQVTIVKKDQHFLAAPLLSPLDSVFCTASGNQRVKILNYPAASSNITVLVMLDTSHPLAIGADSSFTLVIGSLHGYNHSVKVSFTDATGQSKTTSVFFTIRQNPIPGITLHANTSTVGAGSDPVIITATAVIGNGETPLFTFAWDNGFDNIIQSAGNNNSLTLLPTTLPIGDSWVYGKISVTDACQTTQSATDSIKITHRITKGLVDPDFPDQAINAFPNPFERHFTVTGLSASKKYELMMYNGSGQKVMDQIVSNQTSYGSSQPSLLKGFYALRVYDLTKDRLIGIIRMISQ